MKQIMRKKLPTLVLAICLLMSNATMAFAGSEQTQPQVPSLTAIDKEIAETADYLKSTINVTSLNSTSDFYSTSRTLVLLLRSGVDCSNLVDSYLDEIKTSYISNGVFTFEEPLSAYAYVSIILALTGRDATNFNGINLIEKYENAIMNTDQAALNGLNPYNLPHLYTAAYAYANDFKDSKSCLSRLKTAILANSNENGINYWGNSADNNGFGLSGLSALSSTDDNVKILVNNALAYSQTLLKSDGTSAGDFQWTTTPNSDSTAASLVLYSTYGKTDLAAKTYVGLLTFKNQTVPGSYSYTNASDPSSSYSTVDALYGLISYRALLANQSAPFDVSDIIASGITKTDESTNDSSPVSAEDTTMPAVVADVNIDTITNASGTSPQTGDTTGNYIALTYISLMCTFGFTGILIWNQKKKEKSSNQ